MIIQNYFAFDYIESKDDFIENRNAALENEVSNALQNSPLDTFVLE